MKTANARRMTRVKSRCGRGRRCAAWITPSATSGWTAQSPLCAGIRASAKRHCSLLRGLNALICDYVSNSVMMPLIALLEAINKAKPAAAKGQYIRSCVVAATMGPGVKINPNKVG